MRKQKIVITMLAFVMTIFVFIATSLRCDNNPLVSQDTQRITNSELRSGNFCKCPEKPEN